MDKRLVEMFKGKTVSLLGAGVSNMPLASLLAPVCGKLTVRDSKSPEELGDNGKKLLELGAELITGEKYLSDIFEDYVFRSPGIRPDVEGLRIARENGTVVTSEMELFLTLCPCPVYAITGSDGKTTTTTITSMLLSPEGKVFLGGNIGEPLLHRLDLITEKDAVAVELSSFQLMTVDAPVEVAAITNITPNHLNWHTGMDEYTEAKKNILRHCGRAVLNLDNEATRTIGQELLAAGRKVTYFSLSAIDPSDLGENGSAVWFDGKDIFSFFPEEGLKRIMSRSDIKLPGMHNIANYMTAVAVTHGTVEVSKIKEVASTFGGVEHRLEFIRELDGITYINGSIDSSPTRTAAALSALNDRPVVLIAGGYDKHLDYAPLAEAVFSSTVHAVVLTGATAESIKNAIITHPLYISKVKDGFVMIMNPDFDSSLTDARNNANPGDTVILSPASASFDRFKNFEERGRHFKDLVNRLN